MNTKSMIRVTGWAMAAMGAWVPLAGAQDPPNPTPNPPNHPAPAKPPQTKPGPKTVLTEPQTLKLLQGDRLIGMELHDLTGGRVGTIEEVILRPVGGIGYVVVQATVDGQSHLYPIPWSALRFEGGTDADPLTGLPGKDERLVIGFDKERLKTAPSFSMEQWPADDDATLFTQADTFYRVPETGRTPPVDPMRPGDTVQPRMNSGSSTLRLSRLQNVGVTDSSGKPLGTLGTFVVDPMGGRLNYATMTLSDGAANGRVIAIPWEAFRVSQDNAMNRFQLNVPADRLPTAPQFQTQEESWKQMSDPNWVGQMYSYYSIRPYWTQTPAKTPGEGTRPPPGS